MLVSVSTMTYCVVQINCLPLSRFLKEVTMKTAEERYEELGTVGMGDTRGHTERMHTPSLRNQQ